MHTVHTTVISEKLQVDIFSFVQLAAYQLLMAYFQQTVTWIGLELNAVGVTGKGWATRESGVTRGGGVTRIGWTLDDVSTGV